MFTALRGVADSTAMYTYIIYRARNSRKTAAMVAGLSPATKVNRTQCADYNLYNSKNNKLLLL